MQEITLSFQKGSLPLYEQLYRHIAGEIRGGRLTENTRLPSKRAMVRHLHISLSTVETAYAMLCGEGYVQSLPKKGYYVMRVPALPPVPAAPRAPQAQQKPPPAYNLSTGGADSGLFPFKAWTRLMHAALKDSPHLLQKGEAQGERALRETLAQFLYQFRGVRTGADSILIGAGADYLLYVLLCLLGRDSLLAAEDPGYQGVYRLARRHGAAVLPLPMDGQGIRPDALHASGARAVFVTPSHQFPLGLTMPIGRRAELLAWAEQTGGYIVEDDYDSEFRHLGRPIPALQGLGGQERVVYIGTFSRSLAPSMRIAYMALPARLMDKWHALFAQGGGSVSRFEQETLRRFIEGGHYARHLRRAGSAYAGRCQALCAALKAALPGLVIRGEEAGLHFLLCYPPLSAEEMAGRAARQGLALSTLAPYCHAAAPLPSTVVMGYAGLQDSQVAPVAALLQKAWA